MIGVRYLHFTYYAKAAAERCRCVKAIAAAAQEGTAAYIFITAASLNGRRFFLEQFRITMRMLRLAAISHTRRKRARFALITRFRVLILSLEL